MKKMTSAVAFLFGLMLVAAVVAAPQRPQPWQEACIQRCVTSPGLGDPELQRQEIVSLEKEAARAIQLYNGTFFRRVYGDDFAGTLSHGQAVTKNDWLNVIESTAIKYQSFNATDIKVRLFEETAIATSLWSTRAIVNGQVVSGQMRTIHVYINTPQGWHVVSGQATNLPPDAHLTL